MSLFAAAADCDAPLPPQPPKVPCHGCSGKGTRCHPKNRHGRMDARGAPASGEMVVEPCSVCKGDGLAEACRRTMLAWQVACSTIARRRGRRERQRRVEAAVCVLQQVPAGALDAALPRAASEVLEGAEGDLEARYALRKGSTPTLLALHAEACYTADPACAGDLLEALSATLCQEGAYLMPFQAQALLPVLLRLLPLTGGGLIASELRLKGSLCKCLGALIQRAAPEATHSALPLLLRMLRAEAGAVPAGHPAGMFLAGTLQAFCLFGHPSSPHFGEVLEAVGGEHLARFCATPGRGADDALAGLLWHIYSRLELAPETGAALCTGAVVQLILRTLTAALEKNSFEDMRLMRRDFLGRGFVVADRLALPLTSYEYARPGPAMAALMALFELCRDAGNIPRLLALAGAELRPLLAALRAPLLAANRQARARDALHYLGLVRVRLGFQGRKNCLVLEHLSPLQSAGRLAQCFECWQAHRRAREAAAPPSGKGLKGAGAGAAAAELPPCAHAQRVEEERSCTFCYSAEEVGAAPGGAVWAVLRCGHYYHKRCLLRYLAEKSRRERNMDEVPRGLEFQCPLCRRVCTRISSAGVGGGEAGAGSGAEGAEHSGIVLDAEVEELVATPKAVAGQAEEAGAAAGGTGCAAAAALAAATRGGGGRALRTLRSTHLCCSRHASSLPLPAPCAAPAAPQRLRSRSAALAACWRAARRWASPQCSCTAR